MNLQHHDLVKKKYRIWRAPFCCLLKLLLLFNKKWRSRHCFALHFDFKKTDRFLVQSVSYHALFVCLFVFRSCFLFCSTHAFRSASQSSRSAAAEATAQRSPQVIFLGIHTAKYSVMSTWIAAVLELNQLNAERKGWDCQQLTPHCKKKRKNRRLNTKFILPFSQAKQ